MLRAASPFDSICRATAAVSSQLLHHPPTPDSETNYRDYFADTSSRRKVGTDLQTNARDVVCRAVKQPQHAKTCSSHAHAALNHPSSLKCYCRCSGYSSTSQGSSTIPTRAVWNSAAWCGDHQLKWKPLQSWSWKQASLGGSQLAPHAPDADWLSPCKNYFSCQLFTFSAFLLLLLIFCHCQHYCCCYQGCA